MARLCVSVPFVPELPKSYDPVGTEARWQQVWEDQGAFDPDPMGNTALIDTIVRYPGLAVEGRKRWPSDAEAKQNHR